MPYPDSEYPSILRGKDKRESQRLLAAAPDLLNALKLLRDPDGDGRWPCYCDDPHFEGGMCENCVATAAIDKAEGRSGETTPD